MAGLRKDVELIFRGEDRASPTIKAVRKSVADLTSAVTDQIDAASRGEGSIDELAKAFRGLKAAQGDVGEIVKLAAAYEKQAGALADQAKKTQDAQAKLEALNAQVAAAEAPTKRLQNARDAAERALQASLAKEQQLQAAVRETGAALDAAGGDSKDFAATQDRIRQAAIETARALRDAAAALDTFKGKQATGKANVAAVAEMQQFNQLAAGSGLPQAQIAFISTLENKLQALQTAIREDQASMAALNAELGDRASADAAQRARAMAAALDEADAAAARLKATQGFRQMATDIEAGARDISRFGPQVDTAAQSAQRFADTIQSILAPTQAASATLGGLDQVIAQAETVTDGAKRRMSEYNAEINNLQSASAGISTISKMIDDFQAQEVAVNGAKAAMDAAQAEVLQLAQAIRTAEAPTQEMANSLKQAEANLENAGRAFQTESTKLNGMSAALTKAGVDTRNLGAAQATLTGQAERLAAAQAKVTAKTTGKGSFLGLTPNEMQNLGFQVNDIIVSIASGQAPMRVFLQQGAQIGQIIPGAFSAILRFAGPLAILATVFISIASAIKKTTDEAERLKAGAGIVEQLGAGTTVTAKQFADLAGQMENLGAKAADARKALVDMAGDGLNADQMQAYIDAAKAAAEVTGVDFKDALESIRTSFQGGMEDILALNDSQHIYNDTQLETIQRLFDEGKADEARTLALQIYRDNQEGVAASQRGPWKTATEQLSQAWQNFLGWLSNTQPIQNAKNNLRDLAVGAAFVATALAQITSGKGFDYNAAAKTALGIGNLPSAKPISAGNPNQTTAAGNRMLQQDREALAIAKARTPAEKFAAEAIQKRRQYAEEAAKAGLHDAQAQQHIEARLAADRATFDQQQAKRDTAAGKRADAARRKQEAAARAAARRAQAEQNRIDNASEGIQRQIEQMNIAVSKATGVDDLPAKLAAVDEQYAKLFRDIDDFSKKTNGKGLINGKSIKEVRDTIIANEELLKKYVQLADYEGKIKALEEDRDARLKDIADQVQRGTIKPEDGLQQSNAIINDFAVKIASVAQDAIVFAQAMKAAAGAKPTPELDAFLSKMANISQRNSGGTNTSLTSETSQKTVDEQMTALNKLVADRNALVEHENNLVQAGLESYSDAQKKIQVFYNDTNKLIRDQIALILKLAASWATGTPEQQRAFAALKANLQNVGLEAQGTNASFIALKGHVTDILTQNIVQGIDSIAQAFARLATGGESAMGVLEDIGRAFLTLIANVLQTVATLIIEALVLDAVDKATGGILKPLLQMTAAAASFHHEGGIVGTSKRERNVSPLAFVGAPRYHSGGIAGLAPDERATILKKGEEVLTDADPRHRMNGGLQPAGGGSGPVGLRQVLAIGDDEIAAAMAGGAGEKTVMTHLSRNRATLKQWVNS
jgi:hypothetical protein